jgi:citrate lyase subunit beta/citryl-CoA lyase
MTAVADWTVLLFVPGDRPERFGKAAAAGADAVIIDLEDAVAPAAKAAARQNLSGLALAAPVMLRINGLNSPWAADDLSAAASPIAAVMLPKAEGPDQIAQVRQATGLAVVALVETALGLARAREIAGADGVARLAFGSLDFAADLGAAHSREALLAARSELVLASRLAGLPPPIDGVTPEIDQSARTEDDARYAASLGFGAKLCIHPAQILPIRRGLAPSETEIAWAEAVLAAGPEGATRLGALMVDAPVRARAERILAARDRSRTD